MEYMRTWIISVLTMVIFMVLVDMILPDNNFRKYAKLATGLIVIITILSPVFKLFDNNVNVEAYINQYVSSYNSSSKIDENEIQKDVQKQTLETYKEKLKTTIEQSIYNKTGKKYIITNMSINEDVSSYDFSEIKSIELKKNMTDEQVKPVDKVVIGKESPSGELPKDSKVLAVLKSEFNVNSSVVKFVK